MPSKDEAKLVVWPHYFDRNLTRAQGRRVPANLAVEEPRAHHVFQAAKSLGLKAELMEDARPPAFWHLAKGCVFVPKSGTKEEVLKQIARRL